VREVVIVALAGFLIGIIVAAVLVHFLSWHLDDRAPLPARRDKVIQQRD
jgi:hypothetical protein